VALIVDPDDLTQNTEVTFDTAAKTIALAQAGNLSTDGVTLKCLYSFCKEEWKNDASLISHPFPFTPITDEQFELKDGWDFANDASRYLVRTGGWAVVDTSGVTQQMWAGVVTLGSLETGTQVYYNQSGGSAVDFQLTGPVNQAIQIYQNGGADNRTSLKLFAREQGDLFAQAALSGIGVTDLTFQVYRFPLATAPDLKISRGDVAIAGAPYNGITITYHATPIARTIGGTSYNFDVEIDGNGQSIEDIYERVQYELRLATDIDDGTGTVIGNTADDLLFFVGDTLKGREGVYITNFDSTDTNSILHDPNGAASDIAFPFTASLTLEFGTNLVNDSDAVYRVFFTNDDAGDNLGNDFGTANAVLVDNASGVDMSGTVGGATSVSLTYDYDGNVQRGSGSAGVDAPITVVAIGLATGQYVSATGTIARSTANVVSLVAPLERNYVNP
jgi:hypothetical protein